MQGGPVALKHPYLSDDIKLIDNIEPPQDVMERLLGYWERSVARRR